MSNSYQYRRVSQILTQSLAHFDEIDHLFAADNHSDEATLQALRTRWQGVLDQGATLAEYVKSHHRTQSPPVLAALEELAKYSDVRRPFRLSVIGQKGVGKSALVNALLGAAGVQYTPSEVAGKAVSGTRIRLLARTSESEEATHPAAPWQVVFLTPRRLWEIGSYLLGVAQLDIPHQPGDLDKAAPVMQTLSAALNQADNSESAALLGSTMQIQATNARQTLVKMLEVYRQNGPSLPADYRLWLDDADVDGPVSPYLRQTESNQYLIVDYVERYLPAEEAGLIAGQNIELEDVLGLDDPRDSFFALEAFREAFAVIMVFKCDRGLNTESTSLLQNLFSRDETELAQFGNYADLNKAIIVANQFDAVTSNVAFSSDSKASPLAGIEAIRRELSRYTRQSVPIYLTTAQLARNAQAILGGNSARPSAAYTSYLESLANLLSVVEQTGGVPDYLDFVYERRAEVETAAFDPTSLTASARAELTLEMSGLPRLIVRVKEALEVGSILRGRVANAEYYYNRAISESAICYARQMLGHKLDLSELNQPPASLESRLFSQFQHEIRQRLQELDFEMKQSYFNLAQRYIHGPIPAGAEQARHKLLETIRQLLLNNQELIQLEQHISTGETVTDAWRKVFEYLNDWLALEAGRQLRVLVGPLIADVEQIATGLQKQLTTLAASPLDETFWANYHNRLAYLRQRLQLEAEMLSIGYYTDNRFSVYDVQIAEALHVGAATKRREAVIALMQERVCRYYNQLWHLLAKVAMTDLSAFVGELRHYVLGLNAEGSLLVGFDLAGKGQGVLPPEDSLVAILNQRYHSSESFRRQYALREPTPAERLTIEIKEWLGLLQPPLDGLGELGKAIAIVGVGQSAAPGFIAVEVEFDGVEEADDAVEIANAILSSSSGQHLQADRPGEIVPTTALALNRLRFPIESRHPYMPITRQMWQIDNPDEAARYTRLHFSRIEINQSNRSSNNHLTLLAVGQSKAEAQIITGEHTDFWSEPLPGRTIKIAFVADTAQPGWGFRLDAVETVPAAQTVAAK